MEPGAVQAAVDSTRLVRMRQRTRRRCLADRQQARCRDDLQLFDPVTSSRQLTVATANKALLALHGAEIFDAANRRGVDVAFEASVAGGIPILRSLREGLAANRIESLYGIMNGTTNYVLTEMEQTGEDFDVVVKRAQDLGYAEADPTFDVGSALKTFLSVMMSSPSWSSRILILWLN